MSTGRSGAATLVFDDRSAGAAIDEFPHYLLGYHSTTHLPWHVVCVPTRDAQMGMVAVVLFPTKTPQDLRDELSALETWHATRAAAEAAILRDAAARGVTDTVLVHVAAGTPTPDGPPHPGALPEVQGDTLQAEEEVAAQRRGRRHTAHVD